MKIWIFVQHLIWKLPLPWTAAVSKHDFSRERERKKCNAALATIFCRQWHCLNPVFFLLPPAYLWSLKRWSLSSRWPCKNSQYSHCTQSAFLPSKGGFPSQARRPPKKCFWMGIARIDLIPWAQGNRQRGPFFGRKKQNFRIYRSKFQMIMMVKITIMMITMVIILVDMMIKITKNQTDTMTSWSKYTPF